MTDIPPAPHTSAPVPTKPADTPTPRPPDSLDVFKGFIGDLARPFALYSTSGATAWAIFHKAPADVIGAAGAVVAVLFSAKAAENAYAAKQDANVKVAQAGTTTP